MALTEEEANVLWNGSILDLEKYWKENDFQLKKED
jgi:hypothetical protein